MPNTPDIDISALAEALNEKMDRDMDNKATNVHYIVETWHSGTEWYRVWSDGWIEQGGHFSASNTNVNLNISFSNTNYTILQTLVNGTQTTYYSSWSNIQVKATSYFKPTSNANATACDWYACGY